MPCKECDTGDDASFVNQTEAAHCRPFVCAPSQFAQLPGECRGGRAIALLTCSAFRRDPPYAFAHIGDFVAVICSTANGFDASSTSIAPPGHLQGTSRAPPVHLQGRVRRAGFSTRAPEDFESVNADGPAKFAGPALQSEVSFTWLRTGAAGLEPATSRLTVGWSAN
jgi:hypothetical protein